jgi:hypothetical protein
MLSWCITTSQSHSIYVEVQFVPHREHGVSIIKTEFQLNHASGGSKQAWHVTDAVCTVLELLMMGGETARNMYSIDNNKEYCKTLHLVGCA